MKKYLVLIAMALSTFAFAQTTYYTCATPSGTNISVDVNGTTCLTTQATWNSSGAPLNTLVVRSGTTYTLSAAAFEVFDNIIIQSGGQLNYTPNNTSITITSGARITVNGTFLIDGSNTNLVVAAGGALQINTGGTVSNAGSANNNIVINGTVEGNGTFDWTGNTPSGTGTINGRTTPWTSPIDLSTFGFTWDGATWTPSAPSLATSRATFTGNWVADSSVVPTAFTAGYLTINASVKVRFTGDRSGLLDVVNNGLLVLKNDCRIGSSTVLSGTGNVKLTQNITGGKYSRIGFAVKSGTIADLTANFPLRDASFPAAQQSLFRWDAATANWIACPTSTSLANDAIAVFAFGSGSKVITVTRPNADFNNTTKSLSLNYNNGQSSSFLTGVVAVTEGWNMLFNPFQAYLDWNLVDDLLPTTFFSNLGVAVQNSAGSYEYWAGGVGTAQYIAPHQSFFVQVKAGATYPGSLNITNAMRTTSPGAPVSTFKGGNGPRNFALILNGPGGKQITHIGLNDNATGDFDGTFDARWFEGSGARFYTTDNNGNFYGVNQSDDFQGNQIPLVFAYPVNGETFTIEIDNSNWPVKGKVFLKDDYLGTQVQLKAGQPYSFTSNSAAPMNRFRILIAGNLKAKTVGIDENDESTAFGWFDGDDLAITSSVTLTDVKVEVFNVGGQIVQSQVFDNIENARMQVMGHGVFVIRVSTANGEAMTFKAVKM